MIRYATWSIIIIEKIAFDHLPTATNLVAFTHSPSRLLLRNFAIKTISRDERQLPLPPGSAHHQLLEHPLNPQRAEDCSDRASPPHSKTPEGSAPLANPPVQRERGMPSVAGVPLANLPTRLHQQMPLVVVQLLLNRHKHNRRSVVVLSVQRNHSNNHRQAPGVCSVTITQLPPLGSLLALVYLVRWCCGFCVRHIMTLSSLGAPATGGFGGGTTSAFGQPQPQQQSAFGGGAPQPQQTNAFGGFGNSMSSNCEPF